MDPSGPASVEMDRSGLASVEMDKSETAVSRGSKKGLNTTTDATCFTELPFPCSCSGSGDDVANRLSLGHEESSKFTGHEHCSHDASPALNHMDSSLYYDTTGDKILIIFNHFVFKKTRHQRKYLPRNRYGTYKDVENLEKTFRRLGFMVITHDDWKYKDIMNYLTDVCKKDHSNTSCVAVTVMTHGKGSRVSAADRKYPITDITDTLRSASSLAGKPKLFFIQACRTQHTQPKARQNDEIVSSLNADCLLLYSTYEDHYSFRDSKEGSWIMQALCEVIETHHDFMNLVQMVTLVHKMVANRGSEFGKQMPVTEFNLKKFLKF